MLKVEEIKLLPLLEESVNRELVNPFSNMSYRHVEALPIFTQHIISLN